MGTEVLPSRDCLNHRLHLDFYDSRPPPPMNNSRKKPLCSPPTKQPRPARSKPSPVRSGRKFGSRDKEDSAQPETRKPLVMGQVTILKRGEELKTQPPPPPPPAAVDLRSDGHDSSVLCSTYRLGPDPEILPKFSDLEAVYAGPAFISSPSPSSLPFPALFLKKGVDEVKKSEIATRGLRCLLKLDAIV